MGGYVVYAMWLLVWYMQCACRDNLCARPSAYCGTLSAISNMVQYVLCDVPIVSYSLFAVCHVLEPVCLSCHANKQQNSWTKKCTKGFGCLTHDVTQVHDGGVLYELDGLKRGPVARGNTTPCRLLQDSALVR